jgi:hypothetical protein
MEHFGKYQTTKNSLGSGICIIIPRLLEVMTVILVARSMGINLPPLVIAYVGCKLLRFVWRLFLQTIGFFFTSAFILAFFAILFAIIF